MVAAASAASTARAHLPQQVIGGAYSAAGSQRPENEDAFSLPPAGAPQARYGTLIALADGVGGLPGGAAASRAAVHCLQALYYAPLGSAEPGARLRQCFEAVNALSRHAFAASRAQDSLRPLTTLVAAVVYNERLWVANVGDSRAYRVRARDGQLQRLTEDHNQVVMALASGAPGSRPGAVTAAATQPLAPTAALTRAIGLDDTCQVDLYNYTWETGDRLILASDGLRGLSEAHLAQLALAGSPTAIARALVKAALERDASDNATAVVAAWQARLARRPVTKSSAAALSLATVVAGLVGLGLGWLTAAGLFIYFGGLELIR